MALTSKNDELRYEELMFKIKRFIADESYNQMERDNGYSTPFIDGLEFTKNLIASTLSVYLNYYHLKSFNIQSLHPTIEEVVKLMDIQHTDFLNAADLVIAFASKELNGK